MRMARGDGWTAGVIKSRLMQMKSLREKAGKGEIKSNKSNKKKGSGK